MLHSHRSEGDGRIRDAICGHVDWLRKFEGSLEAGKLQQSPHVIGRDDQCEFGKWLKSLAIDHEDPVLDKLEIIVGLHRRFHQSAGAIASKIEAGEHDAAHEHFTSKAFQRMTHSLVINLHDWRQDFKSVTSASDVGSALGPLF